ncbi:LIM/homeobox protein Lhx3 isoform X1, partial [Biomphalaria pfeifferi]
LLAAESSHRGTGWLLLLFFLLNADATTAVLDIHRNPLPKFPGRTASMWAQMSSVCISPGPSPPASALADMITRSQFLD